jgi:hypothetical protein
MLAAPAIRAHRLSKLYGHERRVLDLEFNLATP